MRFNVWHGVFFVLGAVMMLALNHLLASVKNSPASSPNLSPSQITSNQLWGQLEQVTIDLKRPETSFPANLMTNEPIAWFFDGGSEKKVEELFRTNDLTAMQRQVLLDKSKWEQMESDFRISPGLETVLNLSPSARESIYEVLRKNRRNIFYVSPFRFALDKFDSWLFDSGLSKTNQGGFSKDDLSDQGYDLFFRCRCDGGVMLGTGTL